MIDPIPTFEMPQRLEAAPPTPAQTERRKRLVKRIVVLLVLAVIISCVVWFFAWISNQISSAAALSALVHGAEQFDLAPASNWR
ncbi:hypothetical protein [Brevibacterium album]|uniref:hypothetical protein n=1 Tax=Brevibacterium album TaxID=417948 RepID=UPI000412AC70|nr:hypothetical protein [Brevibacterium album]